MFHLHPIQRYLRKGSCQPYANKLSITSLDTAYMRTYRTAVWRSLPIDRAELASYYENTLIGTSISNPNFAPQMWNQHEATQMMIQCSSNIPEGWHHGFHSMLSCSKPTIWQFLDRLKAKRALTDVKKTQKRRAGTT